MVHSHLSKGILTEVHLKYRLPMMIKMRFDIVLLFLGVLLITGCNDSSHSPLSNNLKNQVNFNFEVRPILVQKCYLCHGPDATSRKANLRLDTYEGAIAKLKDGTHAIVPGEPDKSELVKRINSTDPELIMPTPESHLSLSEEEKDILIKWIDQGAVYTEHWAFIPPQANISKDNITEQIDFYINEKLESKGLTASGIADKNTLIRRVAFLTTGKPPTTQEIDLYVRDSQPEAYEKMVERFLNSKFYGEVWARHWMDIVRYAETKGHEFDYTIQGAWRYRDYLIRAFNDDVPYDAILKEHIAGDLLDSVRIDPKTGFNESILGPSFYTFGEGSHSPVDVHKDEADRIDNIVDVTTKAFQGLTVSCARCHDHKFDPILAADYYGLYGVIESTRFSPVPMVSHDKRNKTLTEIAQIKDYIRGEISDNWKDPIAQSILSKTSSSGSKDHIAVIGDFRGQDLEGWNSDGTAFGTQTTLGDPIFNLDRKRLVKLEEGMASSLKNGPFAFGALRSPNWVIDKNIIGIRARGKSATLRIIVDNFQVAHL